MIAIPIDTYIDSSKSETESSKLFGNVKMFALYKPQTESFSFVKNDGSGNGIESAKFLKNSGATEVVYSFMGDGPFNELSKSDITVYYIGKEPMKLSKIVEGISLDKFIKVDTSNASTYLDPGTATENCNCGCS